MNAWRSGTIMVVVASALAACDADLPPATRVLTAEKQDLVLDVEVTGTLKSLESEQVGPPGAVVDTWEFKIVRMVPEGTRVKAGDDVIGFDPSTLEQKLQDFDNEAASIDEEMRKMRAEHNLAVLNDGLDLEDAEAKRRKADLKADKPVDLTAELTLRVSRIERDLAQREVEFRHERERAKGDQARSDLEALGSRLGRARGRVAEIKSAITAMSVKARRAGTVVYKQDWRGEKKKVGDGMWRGESVLEIASLDHMAALGQVDEVDASKVAVGQRVGLRLEAHPDKEYAGRVERVATLVQTESPESRVKVVQLDIRLDENDALLMRPGMRFRGRIEIARLPAVLQVPLEAVNSTPTGPVVWKLHGSTPEATPVKLGRRGRLAVEVLQGLGMGDRVMVRQTARPSEANGTPMGPS